ncbi:MAG: ParB/RepB/Spo0J family partition protein [Patescibacteria group bacterium]
MENIPVQGPVFLIETEKIRPNPQQPRREFNEEGLRELATSIREFGVLQPIVVTKIERVTETGTEVEYELIAGERRLLASRIAGMERVPAIIRSVSLDKERLELAIIENIQRVDLNPIESARAYAKLQDKFGLTQREIASRLGKSREVVANSVRLLVLPQEVQDAVARGTISESQARLLLTVTSIAEQQMLFQDLMRNNMSVRDLKARIHSLKEKKETSTLGEDALREKDPEIVLAEREMEEVLGAKVKVERSGATGKITITFYSPEELYGIVSKLKEKRIPPSELAGNVDAVSESGEPPQIVF